MSLPEATVQEGLKLAEGAQIFFHRFEDLTWEELIAVAALGWKAYNDQLKDSLHTLEFLGKMR